VTDTAFDAIAVIVVNYGSSALLEKNLLPLVTSVFGVRVVVVDNFSTSAERERVAELCTTNGWLAELRPANDGFGAGMNAGVVVARANGATAFLLLNPDAYLTSASLSILVSDVRADPLLLASPTVLRPDGSVWFGGADLSLDDGRVSARSRRNAAMARFEPWLSGACLMVSVELWDRVGGFADGYFLYWEDIDLSHRVLAAGGRLEVSATATAIHAEGGTQGVGSHASGTPKSTTYYYYNIRNRLLFAATHLSAADVVRWRRTAPRVAWEVLLEGGRRQLVRSPRPMMAAARGLRDGLRMSGRKRTTASERSR
jgi:GT2 family glycosyltransferase